MLLGKSTPQAALASAASQVNPAPGGELSMTVNTMARPGTRRAGGLVRRALDSEQFNGWAFVTPGVAVILLFGAVPIVWSAVMSFQKSSLGSSTPFVGLANYRTLVHDPVVSQAIQHTLIYTALFVPGTMVGGAVPGGGDEQEDPLHLDLPHGRLRDDGDLHDQRGDRVHLAVRPLVRGGELLLQQGRPAAAAVPQLTVRGAVRDRGDDHLGLDRLRGGGLPGGAPGSAAGRCSRRPRSTAPGPGGRSAGSRSRCSARRRCSSRCGSRSTPCNCSTRST